MFVLTLALLLAPGLRQEVTITATVRATVVILRPAPTVYKCSGQLPPFLPAGWRQVVVARINSNGPLERFVGTADGKGNVIVNGVSVTPGKDGVR